MTQNFKELKFNDAVKQFTALPQKSSMYLDINLSPEGITYNNFLKLRYSSINNQHIKKLYTIHGWYLMFAIMVQTQKNCYLKTTIATLYLDCHKKITKPKIKTILLELNKKGVIKLSKVRININTPIEIIVPYNNDKFYDFKEGNLRGYKALPKDYIKLCLKHLKPAEWAIFTVLCVRYNDYAITQIYNSETSTYMYNYQRNHYAFPDVRQISECIGLSPSQTGRYIKKLNSNPLGIIKVNSAKGMNEYYIGDGIKGVGNRAPNSTYQIRLFERVEYIYYHIIRVDTRPESKKIKDQNKFESMAQSPNYKTLQKPDYYLSYYGSILKQYEELLSTKDYEGYQNLITTNKCMLQKFS